MAVNAQAAMMGCAVADTHLGTPEFSCTVEYTRESPGGEDSLIFGLALGVPALASSGPAPAGSLKMSEERRGIAAASLKAYSTHLMDTAIQGLFL
jgi:hypothetical protein